MAEKSPENKKLFPQKMTEILNYGAINLAMAIGYRIGLFDVMDSFEYPSNLRQTISEQRGFERAVCARMVGCYGLRRHGEIIPGRRW